MRSNKFKCIEYNIMPFMSYFMFITLITHSLFFLFLPPTVLTAAQAGTSGELQKAKFQPINIMNKIHTSTYFQK